jgi:hypothetical protein
VKAGGIGGEREGDFVHNFNGNHQFFDSEFFPKNGTYGSLMVLRFWNISRTGTNDPLKIQRPGPHWMRLHISVRVWG